MQYANGEAVKLGDKVRLGQDSGGVVVVLIDTGEYAPSYPKSEWEYLKTGVMINFPTLGLIHYTAFEPGLELIARELS